MLKYDRNAQLRIQGTVVCPSSGKAVLTSIDDHSAGEPIGAQLFPTGTYASQALYVYPNSVSGTIRNLHIRYAYEGVLTYCPSISFQNHTFLNCTRGIAAYWTSVYGTATTFCDVPIQLHNYGNSYWSLSGTTTLVGKNDNDGDRLSNAEELIWWATNPLNANTLSPAHKDGAYHLTAVTGEIGTRTLVTLSSSSYDPATDFTALEFIVGGAALHEFHEIYVRVSTGQFWRNLFAEYLHTSQLGDHYLAFAKGNQSSASFAALLDQDGDYDGLPDGYEAKMIQSIVGNADSSSLAAGIPAAANNGRGDGDDDYDGDRLTNLQERLYGTNPLVAESTADSDGDGMPNWYEDHLARWVWGIGNADPWADSDGDDVPNIVEFDLGSNPAYRDYGGDLFPPPLAEAEFATFQYTVAYSAAKGPAGNPNFPTAGISAGPLGLTLAMTVEPSSFSGAGTANLKFDIMPLQGTYFNVWPFSDDGTPVEGELQKPDPLDGQAYRILLDVGTSLAEGAWAEINPMINSLRQKTLEHVSATSIMKINYLCRDIQWLNYQMIQAGAQHPAVLMQIKHRLSLIHSEITKLSAVHRGYIGRFPDPSRYVGKILSCVKWVSFGVSLPDSLDTLKLRIADYMNEVRKQVDFAGAALLSVEIQQFVASIPGMPNSIGIVFGGTSTPFFDPCPLGFYDGGGGSWEDCIFVY